MDKFSNGSLPKTDNNLFNGSDLSNGYPKSNIISGTGLSVHENISPTDNRDGFNAPPKREVPIAICGMALRLPGGLKTPQDFWEFLLKGKDGRTEVPETRYNISAFYDPNGKPASIPTKCGYFLQDDLGALDTSFFSMPRSEVEQANPEHRLMLEVARECVEDAGEAHWKGKNIGCYIGSFGEDWAEMNVRENQGWGNYRLSGTGDFVLSNRISYEMDIRGPSVTIRTACSAGMTGLNEACMALARGDCEASIVGGTNLIMAPTLTATLANQGVLAKDGCCKTFSADADGYARGEAVVGIYIKRLDDAIRDGNPVRAVIRATATNSDGKTPSFSQPSTDAHETLMRRAYAVAGITDYCKTGFVECHGTGTPTGDPIETKAVGRVFGKEGVLIGSVKPNVGHTEGASGLVSVIKVVLALENRMIPPNIRLRQPNPNIPFESAKLTVPLKPTPWPKDRLERASINSFGAGGANAHVILDSAATYNLEKKSKASSDSHHLFLFSANTQQSLTKLIENYHGYVEKNPGKVADLSYTLATRREHLPLRSFAVGTGGTFGPPSPVGKRGTAASIIMVFSGQGAQWPLMGRDLISSNSTFRSTIQKLDSYLQNTKDYPPNWKIEEELSKSGKSSRIHTAEFAQPLCTAIQIALVDCLKEFGVSPQGVVGHSSGEIAAAYASGGLTAKEAILTAFYRGVIGTLSSRQGAMAAVGMSWDETEQYLIPGVNIGCDNSPKSVTISGDIEQIQEVITTIRNVRPDILVRKLQVDKAYHSHQMLDLSEKYESLLVSNGIIGKSPTLPFFSSATGKLFEPSQVFRPKYWRNNMESPVLFRAAVTNIIENPIGKAPIFLEIGPHSALAGPLRQILGHNSRTAPYITAMTRNKNTSESFLGAIGNLYTLHVPINLETLASTGNCLSGLPPYPWNHEESFWFESRLSRDHRLRKYPHHDLLGIRTLESTSSDPSWRNLLHLNTVPWVRDHKVMDDIVFPMAGYIAIAGEAARQVSGIDHAFRIKNFTMITALVIAEGNPTEIITSFRKHNLTNGQESQWWEFTISSHNGSLWRKHCTGMAMAHTETLKTGEKSTPLPKKIDPKTFYQVRLGGVQLGPSFRNLSDISGDTKEQKTTVKVPNGRHPDAESYYLHPCIIDTLVQLAVYNQVHGYTRKQQTWLPIGVEDFNIHRCTSAFTADTWLRMKDGMTTNETRAIHDGNIIASMSGLKMTIDHDVNALEGVDVHAAARLEWGPDINFMNARELIDLPPNRSDYMPFLNELLSSSILYSQKRMSEKSITKPHWQRFQSWLLERLGQEDMSTTKDRSNESILEGIYALSNTLQSTPAAPAAEVLVAICRNLDTLMSVPNSSWETLVSGETAKQFHRFTNELQLSRFLSHLTHSKPNLQVLEIGSIERGPSIELLDFLTPAHGPVLYSKYTFLSEDNMPVEQRGEFYYQNLDFTTGKLNENFLPQSLEGQQYDFIIASNILSKMGNLKNSLKNIKSLLHPDGYLYLQELSSPSDLSNFIFGTNSKWWSTGSDASELNITKLVESLQESGFDASDDGKPDSPLPYTLNLIAIVQRHKSVPSQVEISILTPANHNHNQSALIQELQKKGYTTTSRTLQDKIPPNQDVIILLDAESPFFENIDSISFTQLKLFLSRLENSGIFWVTNHAQLHVQDPRFAPVIGFARCMRSELLLDFATCEVDSFDNNAVEIVKTFSRFHSRDMKEGLLPDFEYAIHNRVVHVGRFYPFALKDSLVSEEKNDKGVLTITTPGRLNTMKWTGKQSPDTLGDEEVEIDICAAGLNFRDILVALKIVEFPQPSLGWEGSGTIKRTGRSITHLQPGDRVAAFGENMLQTSVTVHVSAVIKIPTHMSFPAASSSFFPYLTALYSMVNIGGLEKNQSILIHSACGGVGIAAIEIARMLELEIYATVGSEEKVEYLIEKYGIPRSRIFNSRDSSFETGVMLETKGAGVDVVLNSLSGEFLHVSWRCVAQFGKLVELGKRDFMGHGKLDMDVFLGNRSYCSVDVGYFPYLKRGLLARLMATLAKLLDEGKLPSLQPLKVFHMKDVEEAFRYMQPGQHIGRICISLRESPDSHIDLTTMKAPKTLKLDGKASYLLVGGLGGLGRAISTWMVENGARNLTYLSRNAGLGHDDKSFEEELNSMGCNATFIRGNVSHKEDVDRAITASKQPLKGILQMSAVFKDENFSKMTLEQWQAATAPKVQGTWNLHHSSIAVGTELNFFVLFSSLSGIIGQPGQANYASANTFLDAFVQYRKSLGLPASVIDIGAVDGIGYISQTSGLMQKMGGAGFKPVKEEELLDALMVAMQAKQPTQSPSQRTNPRFVEQDTFILGLSSTIPLNDPSNRAVWKRDRRMAIYHNTTFLPSSISSATSSLKSYIANARSEPSILKSPDAGSFFAHEIGKKLFQLLLKPDQELNTEMTLVELGVDSLLGIELRQWWRQVFGFDISVLEMLGTGTLDALGTFAAKGLAKELGR